MKIHIKCSTYHDNAKQGVHISELDYDVVFVDNGAGFVAPGDTVTLAQIKQYWNENCNYDFILRDEYDDYSSWMKDMIDIGYISEI